VNGRKCERSFLRDRRVGAKRDGTVVRVLLGTFTTSYAEVKVVKMKPVICWRVVSGVMTRSTETQKKQ
jgi:hypothetical protein